jgi:hypothetical protein
MAISQKTVYYSFPALASLVNNTLTNLTQITLDLPESSKTFRSVRAIVTMDDIITATGGSITTKTFGLRLGAAGYTNVANANTLTNTGENLSLFWELNYLSHFTTNWSGTSMTCDFQVTVNQSTGTTLGMVNVCVLLEITYDYDDTSATQTKSVLFPLDAPVGTITTSAVTYDTFPALDTFCPEATKTFRQIMVVVDSNEQRGSPTTDHTMSIIVGGTTVTTGNYEGALASDRRTRYIAQFSAIATNTTHNFQLSTTVARCNHPQAYAIVTYTFTLAGTTKLRLWQKLPMEVPSPMGGTVVGDQQRASREVWIPEVAPASFRVAFFCHWSQANVISGLNMRIGTGAYVTYTDNGAVMCGGNCAMVRNDSAFTPARGRNSVNFDVWRTDTADLGWSLGGWWLISYEADVPASGVGAATRTVAKQIAPFGTAAASANITIGAIAPAIPEADFFIGGVGTEIVYIPLNTAVTNSFNVFAERLSAEGGVAWESVYIDANNGDAEHGAFHLYAQMRSLFQRWSGDLDGDRMDIETARRWRIINGSGTGAGWFGVTMYITYHSIPYTVADSITGFTGTVTLNLHRAESGEIVKTTTRSGDGAYSFTWHDNTELMFVSANDGTNKGRSDDDLAA